MAELGSTNIYGDLTVSGLIRTGGTEDNGKIDSIGTNATRDIFISTGDPSPTDGSDGDIWYKYE